MRYSVDKTTREILFLPLPADLKHRAKPFIDVTVDRFAKGLGALPSRPVAFVRVEVRAVDPPRAAWTRPVHVYFKRAGAGWTLVGLERLSE